MAARDREHHLLTPSSLKTNTLRTDEMIFLPGRIRTCLLEEAYLSMMDPAARATAATLRGAALRGVQPGDGGGKLGFPSLVPAQCVALLPW